MTVTGDGTRNSVAIVTALIHDDPMVSITMLSKMGTEELTAVTLALSFTLVELVRMAESQSPGFTAVYLDAIGKRAAVMP